MAVPKHKTSKQRSNTRYAQWKLSEPGKAECPQCGAPKLSHRVCKSCGYYDKQRSVEVKKEENK